MNGCYLTESCNLVLGKEYPGNMTEVFKQFLEVILLGVLRYVTHPKTNIFYWSVSWAANIQKNGIHK